MKRYYFKMESSLAKHIGYQKDEIHKVTKDLFGNESIADIGDCDLMMARVYRFQQWSAEHFHYTFEPYRDELDGSTGLQINNETFD